MSALTAHHPLIPAARRGSPGAVVIPFPTRHQARPARPAQPGLRVTRRGRLVATVLILALLALVGLVAARGAPPAPEASRTLERVVVLPGDTLWGIAALRATPGEDVRDLVADIVELNALPGSGVAVGQELVVPAPVAG